jgi:hypothetical protein
MFLDWCTHSAQNEAETLPQRIAIHGSQSLASHVGCMGVQELSRICLHSRHMSTNFMEEIPISPTNRFQYLAREELSTDIVSTYSHGLQVDNRRTITGHTRWAIHTFISELPQKHRVENEEQPGVVCEELSNEDILKQNSDKEAMGWHLKGMVQDGGTRNSR